MLELSRGERDRLRQEGMNLWTVFNEKYRTNVIRYRFLYKIMQNENISGRCNIVPEELIREYPDVPFLKILSEDQAIAFLTDVDDDVLFLVVRETENAVYKNCSYNMVRTTISYFNDKIKHHDLRKKKSAVRFCRLGFDPSIRTVENPSRPLNQHLLLD